MLAFVSMQLQSCSTSSKIVATNTVTVPRNKTPIEKLSTKSPTALSSEKENVKLSVNHNENVYTSTLMKKYADILGVTATDLKNEKLFEVIDEWWNVPYKYAGNTKNGIDCSGFVCTVLTTVYNKQLTRGSKSMYAETERVKKENLVQGDLVFFRIKHGQISHVGLYLTNNMFVHASVKYGVTISSLDDPYYKKVFSSGGRWN